MSLTAAAASGFVVFLLSVQVIQGQDGWGVTYTSPTEICASEGSTVEIRCSYTYPSKRYTTVQKTFWFTKSIYSEPVDLKTDSEYSGRVSDSCNEKTCTLTITNLRVSDSAVYKFRFITNQPDGKYAGKPGVTLSVTGLTVRRSNNGLDCHSSCVLPDHPSYIWYKNGQEIQEKRAYYYSGFTYVDSYSCAVKGYEKFSSPPVCVNGQSCNIVTYTERRICAFKGSSVYISCTYNGYGDITSKFWFSPERSHEWWYNSRPEDLSEDSQYSGRVQVIETETGRSTLRITNLGEMDSAQYRFKFKTPSFEWRSSLPGTTLTVTALQVQVTRLTAGDSQTEVELKCQSSCSPAGRLSYVWFNNGERITWEETSSYKGWLSLGDVISCALNGYEEFPSPSVYAPKLPSVSVSPSGEIVEGSSVTLTCSSDANPAANYTWYKENEDSPEASGQIFTITDFRAEHSGDYYCEAQNNRGRHNSTLHLTVAGRTSAATGTITVVLLAVILLAVFLWIRRKKSKKSITQQSDGGVTPDNRAQLNMGPVYDLLSAATQRQPAEQRDDLHYSSIRFPQNQEDALYSNIRPAPLHRPTEEEEEEEEDGDGVEYTAIKADSASSAPGTRREEDGEDSFALYSTVNR